MRDLLIADLPLGALSSFLDPALGASNAAAMATSPCAIAAVGSEKAGALALMRRGLAPAVVTAIPQEKVHGTWALHYRPQAAGGEGGSSGGDGGAAAEGELAKGVGGEQQQQQQQQHHAFLLLSLEGRHTQVFDSSGLSLLDVTGKVSSGFCFESPCTERAVLMQYIVQCTGLAL